MSRAPQLDNQENIYAWTVRDTDSFLSGRKLQRNGNTQLTYSTLKPMKVVHSGLKDPDEQQPSFRKKTGNEHSDLLQNLQQRLYSSQSSHSQDSQSHQQCPVHPEQPPAQLPPNSRLTLHLNQLSQQLESPSNPAELIRYRASSRLLNMISKVLNDPQDDSLTTHTSSLQMLIDRYEFELDEKAKEIVMLKDRLQKKEMEVCRLERRVLDGLAEKGEGRVCGCAHLRESLGSCSSVMSPIVSRATFSLDTVLESKFSNGYSSVSQVMRAINPNPADSFIKVCDGSSIQHRIPTQNSVPQQNQPQFIVDLRGSHSCLYQCTVKDENYVNLQEFSTPNPIIQVTAPTQETEESLTLSKNKMEENSNFTVNQLKPNEERDSNITISNIKLTKSQVETSDYQTQTDEPTNPSFFMQQTQTQTDELTIPNISDQSCQTYTQPILVIQLPEFPEPKQPLLAESAPVTASNSRKIVESMMEEITQRDWNEDQIHSARTIKRDPRRFVQQVLSVSISHTTINKKPMNRLRQFKSLVKATTDIINSTWKLILKLRKKNKENNEAAGNQAQPFSLKPTKHNLENFAVWFNEKYVYYLEQATCKPSEDFYVDALGKVKEYTSAVIDAAETLCT